MFAADARLVVRRSGATPDSVTLSGSGRYALDGLDIDVDLTRSGDDGRFAWSIANASPDAIALDAVAIAWDVPAGPEPRVFVNGYQSWSPTGARRLGTDVDPSRHPHSFRFIRAVHHSDPSVADDGELRSELVTALDLDDGRGPRVVGFDGGSRHGGTIRVRRGDDAPTLLDAWAARTGANENARVDAPYSVGWCSWYYYFHRVSERALHDNLARAGDWPFDVFQLDDGYQRAIGDWLATNDRFPSGVEGAARDIAQRGMTPGLWLAPFLAHPTSDVALAHPDWFAREIRSDEPLIGMLHEDWGGVMWQLDTTRDDVLEHLASTARALVAMGYRYLKLDFTFSPAVPGRFADPTRTPAERVRAGYDAIRAGAGDDTFILGCGCPLGAVIGSVDGMRIGPDVAPWWDVTAAANPLPGYEAAAPSTRNAWVSTLARSFMHRRLWANDPDCLMLRATDTQLAPDAMRAWAYAVAVSGGLAIVSDDLALLDRDARALLDEVVGVGRAADAAARNGPAPRCDDVLAPGGPHRLSAAGWDLTADPADPRPMLTNRS